MVEKVVSCLYKKPMQNKGTIMMGPQIVNRIAWPIGVLDLPLLLCSEKKIVGRHEY
jgi:hypothetical protein